MLRIFFVATDSSQPWRIRLLALGNMFGTLYWTTSVTSITLVTFLDILPSMQNDYDTRAIWWHYCAVVYLFSTVVGNALNVMFTDTTVNRLQADKRDRRMLPFWCTVCKRHTPRRSHHCPLCGVCVLKRDHHCFFLTTCVGFHNQRYFAMFCGYQATAGVYSALLIALHLNKRFNVAFQGLQTLATLLPVTVWNWWFANPSATVTLYQLYLTSLFYACLISGTAAAGFAMWQGWVIVNGQTTHEAVHDMDTYSRTVFENMREVFGPRWYLSAFLPIPTTLEGHGTYGPGIREELALAESNGKGEKRARGKLKLGKHNVNRNISKYIKKTL